MKEEIKIIHEIQDIIKSIEEIDKELNNSSHNIEKLRKINSKARQKFPLETITYEYNEKIKNNGSMIPFEQASEMILLDRLPLYKILYEKELIKIKDEENK